MSDFLGGSTSAVETAPLSVQGLRDNFIKYLQSAGGGGQTGTPPPPSTTYPQSPTGTPIRTPPVKTGEQTGSQPVQGPQGSIPYTPYTPYTNQITMNPDVNPRGPMAESQYTPMPDPVNPSNSPLSYFEALTQGRLNPPSATSSPSGGFGGYDPFKPPPGYGSPDAWAAQIGGANFNPIDLRTGQPMPGVAYVSGGGSTGPTNFLHAGDVRTPEDWMRLTQGTNPTVQQGLLAQLNMDQLNMLRNAGIVNGTWVNPNYVPGQTPAMQGGTPGTAQGALGGGGGGGGTFSPDQTSGGMIRPKSFIETVWEGIPGAPPYPPNHPPGTEGNPGVPPGGVNTTPGSSPFDKMIAQLPPDMQRVILDQIERVSAPSTQSVDQLGGQNSAFFQNMMGQLAPAFAQQRAEALAQAKESAGTLTGTGLTNMLGGAMNRSLGNQQAILADYASRGLQTEVGRQQGDAGRSLQAALSNQSSGLERLLTQGRLDAGRNSQLYGGALQNNQFNAGNYLNSVLSMIGGPRNEIAQSGGAGAILGPILQALPFFLL